MITLYPYQEQALTAIREGLTPDVSRIALEMATGLGKTVTFAAYVDEWLRVHEDRRVLILVHTEELVDQTVSTIRAVASQWSIGVVMAGQDETNTDVVVASVQTLANPVRRGRVLDVGLIIVDEAHHVVAKSYRDILDHYGHVPVIGFTATLRRTDGQGLGTVFQDMVFSRSLPWAIRHGYLVDLIGYTVTVPGVDAGASDAVLDGILADSIAPEAVVNAWKDKTRRPLCQECIDANEQTSSDFGYPVFGSFCPDGCGTMDPAPSTVLFAPLVRSAEAFAEAFRAAGVSAEVVHGAMGRIERKAVLDRYKAGVTTVVCNAMVLTEGWNVPRTKCVIVARPTRSVPLFIQMVGRGLRRWFAADAPAIEDQRCTVLTVAGGTTELAGIADLSDKPLDGQDGKSLLAMEDEYDLGKDIEPDMSTVYSGPVRVQEWDAMVQRSSKAWTYTKGGTPFLPIGKRGSGYVFVVPVADTWSVFWRRSMGTTGQGVTTRTASAPDLELALRLAEDAAQEFGGDIGALLADKGRAWRKGIPSGELTSLALRLGLGPDVSRILAGKASGKAGKLSDLVSKVQASKVLDPLVVKIKEREEAR